MIALAIRAGAQSFDDLVPGSADTDGLPGKALWIRGIPAQGGQDVAMISQVYPSRR